VSTFDKEVYANTLSKTLLIECCPKCNCENIQIMVSTKGEARIICANCGCILRQCPDSVDYNEMDWDIDFKKGE